MSNYAAPTHEEIERCAFFIYLEEGCPEHRARGHWLQAEAQLVADARHDAGLIDETTNTADAATFPGRS